MYFMKYMCFKVPSFSKWPEDSFAAKCLGGIRGPKNPETTLENLFSLLSAQYLWEDKKAEHKEKRAPPSFQKIPYLGIMGATK